MLVDFTAAAERCAFTEPGPNALRAVLSSGGLPYYDSPCFDSGTNGSLFQVGTLAECQQVEVTGHRRQGTCADRRCYAEISLLGCSDASYWVPYSLDQDAGEGGRELATPSSSACPGNPGRPISGLLHAHTVCMRSIQLLPPCRTFSFLREQNEWVP